MTKYVKLNGNSLETLTNEKALNYLDEEELNNAGYKEFVPASYEKGKPYKWTYEETETQIIEHVEEIIPSPEDLLKSAKEQKIAENDNARDEALVSGVVYKNVKFDSDTDQKVNLLAIISKMADTDEITWFGMDNEALLCNKTDLVQIGSMITELHTFCWTKNAEIKMAIAEAETIEEVDEINIDYSME